MFMWWQSCTESYEWIFMKVFEMVVMGKISCMWWPATRGVVVNFDLGERFPRPGSQQRGSLCPCTRRVALLWVGAGGVAPSLWGGITPGKFFEIFDAKSRVWGQFGPENKLIEGQRNEYDVICRNASVLVFHLANDICRSAVPAPKYLPERRSIAFPHHYTPACDPVWGNVKVWIVKLVIALWWDMG